MQIALARWLLATALLAVPASAQAGVLGWGETVTNSAWTRDRYQALAAGWEHTLGLRVDGTLVAWGDNRGNEPRTPIGQLDALIPGTQRTVALEGSGFELVRELRVDDVPVDPQRYRIVSDALVLLDMPQVPSLGAHVLTLSDGTVDSSVPLEVVASVGPEYELGTGDARNVIERRDGLSFLVAGPVGSQQRVYASRSSFPSTSPWLTLGIGNQFTNLFFLGQFQIPAAGWLEVRVPPAALPVPSLEGLLLHSQTFTFAFPAPFAISNLQSIELVLRAGRIRQP